LRHSVYTFRDGVGASYFRYIYVINFPISEIKLQIFVINYIYV